MSQVSLKGRFSRGRRVAGIVLAAGVMSSAAFAGECPSDQKKPDARQPVNMPAVGKTDTLLAAIDLAKEPGGRMGQFRMRRVTVEPGGVVPWHSHGERPAIIYVAEGEIEEYASNCAVPIVHKAGEVSVETHEVSHWWKNLGDKTVVLISADLVK